MNLQNCLELCLRLISFAIFLQTIEVLLVKKSWGIWPSRLKDSAFFTLLVVQVLLCIGNMFCPQLFLSLGICGILIYQFVRFRGFYNGGADAMTFVVLFACTAALLFSGSEKHQSIFLWYIGIQAILSYFVAGLAKAKHKDWWNGFALRHALTQSTYAVPIYFQNLLKGNLARFLSVLLVLFELASPLALLNKTATDTFVLIAVLFHLMNFFAFGLNRFVFAWLAAYPAVYFLMASL